MARSEVEPGSAEGSSDEGAAAALLGRLRADPERPALVLPGRAGGERVVSFGELWRRSQRIAAGLRAAGIGPGSRVLLLAEVGEDLFAAVFGLIGAGAAPVLVDPGLGLDRMLACLRSAAVDAVVGVPRALALRLIAPRAFGGLRRWITPGRRQVPGLTSLGSLERDARGLELPAAGPEETCLIAFTSGSTGPPKGVEISFRNLEGTLACFGQLLGSQRPGEADLIALPALALVSVALGRTCLVPAIDFAHLGRVAAEEILSCLRGRRIGSAFLSPVLCSTLARYGSRSGTRLHGVRVILTGGAPVAIEVALQLQQMLPDGEFLTPYGATEALPVTRFSAREIARETGRATAEGRGVCVGRPLPPTEVRILRPVDGPIPSWDPGLELGPGEVGEVVVRGPQVSRRYLHREAATRAAKIEAPRGDIWHRMGDLGYLDDEGRLWFCGRVRHAVRTAEGAFYPVCVEGLLNELPFVGRSALVGVGGGDRRQLALVVEPVAWRGRAERERWRARILERAAANGVPLRHVLFRRRPLPTDPRHNSKIERIELARWAHRRLARRLADAGHTGSPPTRAGARSGGRAPEDLTSCRPR